MFFRAKCGNGFDDATLEKLQTDLKPKMTKISKNPNQIPKWISINRELIPDFIVIDPKRSPVWEITVCLILTMNEFQIEKFLFRAQNFPNLNNIPPMVYPFDFLV
jgi:ATP-dependent DNA ligase